MDWASLLDSGGERVLPWAGGRLVHSHDRTWRIKGRIPPEFGWYTFNTGSNQYAKLVSRDPVDMDPDFENGSTLIQGYLVGDRFIPDDARVDPDPAKLVEQTESVFCVEPGLDRFTRATVTRDREGRLIYIRQEWPTGPESAVLMAYQDRKDSVNDIPEVTPSLDLAFRWVSYQRAVAEARAAEMERRRREEEARLAAEEARRRLIQQGGTAVGRRELAKVDFEAAARAALRMADAELLDVKDSYNRNEKVVQYRFRHRRLECVVDAKTLQVVDAGVCLDDHRGTKGDTWFTLESLPGVINEAIDLGKLVVWRHVDGDRDW